MPLIINDKEFSDEEVLAEYEKRSAEYLEWRRQKATEFLKNKSRWELYYCEIEEETGAEHSYYIPLSDDIINRVQELKESIANDPELKTDKGRADVFRECITEIGYDIEVDGPMPGEYYYTNIDIDDVIYTYRFDIHLLDWEGNADGRTFPTSAKLTDEEYIDLLALLLDQPDCSFQHLAYLEPKYKAIYDKVIHCLHDYEFNVFYTYCHEYDYAIRMTELRTDAKLLLEQLKKNNDEYPYKEFLDKDNIFVQMAVHSAKRTK